MTVLMRRSPLLGWRWGLPGSSGSATSTLAPELLAFTATGMPYNRRAIPRTFAMPDGTPVAIGNMADLAIETDLFLNPWSKLSAHHRPIGAGAQHYIPPGVDIVDWNAGNYVYAGAGALGDMSLLRERIGLFQTGSTNQGRKFTYKVSSGDPDTQMFEVDGDGNRTGDSVTIKMPAGDEVVGGGQTYYTPYTGGDHETTFCYRDGGVTPEANMFVDFDYGEKEYTLFLTRQLDGIDHREGGGDAVGGSRLFWPGLVLRGHEINDANPGRIGHALNVAVTRHNRQGATAFCHILSKRIAWPAWGTDSSANPASGSYQPTDNQGFLPYGTCLCIRPGADYEALRVLLADSPRGLRLLECFRDFGCHVVDGHGQHTSINGYQQGVMQMRIDGRVGKEADGTEIAGVVDEIDAALQIMLPYLYTVGNVRLRTAETEIWAGDGLPYKGGHGPIGPSSVSTAFDR